MDPGKETGKKRSNIFTQLVSGKANEKSLSLYSFIPFLPGIPLAPFVRVEWNGFFSRKNNLPQVLKG